MRRVMPALLVFLAAGAFPPAAAGAVENLANEPPFGGAAIPPLVRPPSNHRPPPGFRLSAEQAARIAAGADAVLAEREQDGALRPVVRERGDDEWQVDFLD